ncbi:MAG: M23 family metallopeptidase, partial [Clostridia bacterium]|nr:M23 family metallopeptidase [Clostridia bacterium]
HDKGVSSVYRNLNAELPEGIEEGKKVKAGEVIGTVGESALIEIAEPAHLHFELWMNGDCVNAEKEIEHME